MNKTKQPTPILNKCSRCRIRAKSPTSLPVKLPLDHWCDRCLAVTPLNLRSRKISRAELKKLKARQDVAKAAIAAQRAEKLAKQEAAKAANKGGKTAGKSKAKNSDTGGDSSLHYEFAAVRDKLIYEEDTGD